MRFLIIVFSLSFSFVAMAIEQPMHAKGVLIQNPEGNFIEFGHGYRAQLFVGTLPAIGFRYSLKIADSSCANASTEVTCTYDTNYGMNKVNWLWTKNPDPKRIGHPVSYKKSEAAAFKDLDGNIAYKTFYAPDRHSSENHIQPDVLTCNRYDWIPASANQKKIITSWYSSNMANNSETGAAENRALFAVIGVHFKMENKALILTDYDEVQAFSDFFVNPYVHDQQSMIFNDGIKNCQVNWTRRVPASENKKYFDGQMRPITIENAVPLKRTDLFTANQIKAAVYEFTQQEVFVR
jgi:hypothetical protein